MRRRSRSIAIWQVKTDALACVRANFRFTARIASRFPLTGRYNNG
jgi:hypothetical protein